ncbi:MAG: amino acid racemase [Planctomycetes bacterium]|nr:amino acid racemase [Planctomycetota bacterium]
MTTSIRHIGIVGVSPEGAAIFYRQLARHCDRLLLPNQHPRISLHAEPVEEYLISIRKHDWLGVGRLLRKSAEILARCGAEFVVTPDNAVQHGLQIASSASPIPWLTMTDLVAAAIEHDKRARIGVIGTKWVTTGATYQTALGLKGIETYAPDADQTESLHRIIVEELLHGQIRPESRSEVLTIIQTMRDRHHCDGVILACSEAPMLITRENSPLPVYDAGDILAAGAISRVRA